MKPIYNKSGKVVAWLKDDSIIDLTGHHSALIKSSNVYNYNGKHLGVFDNGFFRDHRGGAVAFIDGAQRGPLLPLKALSPLQPLVHLKPLPRLPELPRLPALPSLSWGILWDDFIRQ